MPRDKLLVGKIKNGIVIDHIPAGKAPLVLSILQPDPKKRVIVALNLNSKKYDKKDMIKIEGKYLTPKEIDLISLVAPTTTINRIRNWKIREKHRVKLPTMIEGTFRCLNPRCITNTKSIITKFKVLRSKLHCLHCGSTLGHEEVIASLKIKLISKEKIEKTFLDLLMKKGALRIAPNLDELFVFKSGRKSPNFINLGALTDGESLERIKWAFSSYIALLLEERKLEDFDFVFGPAYKGISLVSLVCEGLNELFGMKKRYLYDRKEAKEYGDKEMDKVIEGAGYFKEGGKILLVDDVITTGKTKLEAIKKLKLLGKHKIVGLILAVDRQEKTGNAIKVDRHSAVENIEKKLGIPVYSILNMKNIFNLVKAKLKPEIRKYWIEYYDKYGAVRLKG